MSGVAFIVWYFESKRLVSRVVLSALFALLAFEVFAFLRLTSMMRRQLPQLHHSFPFEEHLQFSGRLGFAFLTMIEACFMSANNSLSR